MSEDARKSCRTQGKYSDKGQHHEDRNTHKTRDKRLKVSPGIRKPVEKKFHKRKSNESKGSNISLTSETESPVRYEENSEHSFSQLEEPKKYIEISDRGRRTLSRTENGESFILYEPEFFNEDLAWDLFEELEEQTDWQRKNIVIHGEEFPQPRLVAWYGPFPYSYSGASLEPAEMPENILWIKQKVEQFLKRHGQEIVFNSVLLNLYRHNKDSVSWHSDDELSMGVCPTIASISLGEVRKFEMRRKLKRFDEENNVKEDEYFAHLNHGSLIIMDGCMQQDWQHRVPKEYHDKDPRINLTFRTVYEFESMPSIPERKSNSQPGDGTSEKLHRNTLRPVDENFPPLSGASELARSDTSRRKVDYSSCLKSGNKQSAPKERNSSPPPFCKSVPEVEEEWELSTPPRSKAPQKPIVASENDYELHTPPLLEVPYEETGEDSPDSSALLNNLNDDKKNAKVDMVNKNVHPYNSNISSGSEISAEAPSGIKEESGSKESCGVTSDSPTNNVQGNGCKVKNGSTHPSDFGWRPNVEAKPFVPLNAISSSPKDNAYALFSVENLLNYNITVMPCESLLEYSVALRDRVNEKIHDFRHFEQDELRVLCEITDGNQTHRNQMLITERIIEIVKRASSQGRFSPRTQQATHGSGRPAGYGSQYRHSDHKYPSHKRGSSHHRY